MNTGQTTVRGRAKITRHPPRGKKVPKPTPRLCIRDSDVGKVPTKLEQHRAHMLNDVLPKGESYRARLAEAVREYDEAIAAAKTQRRKVGVRYTKKKAA